MQETLIGLKLTYGLNVNDNGVYCFIKHKSLKNRYFADEEGELRRYLYFIPQADPNNTIQLDKVALRRELFILTLLAELSFHLDDTRIPDWLNVFMSHVLN